MTVLLPIYIIIDESEAMRSCEAELASGLVSLCDALRAEPMTAAKLRVTVLGMSDCVRVRLPMADMRAIGTIQGPVIGGRASYAAAFADLLARLPADVTALKSAGHTVQRPAVFFLTASPVNASPAAGEAPLWHQLTDRAVTKAAPAIVACAIGSARSGAADHWAAGGIQPAGTAAALATRPEFAFAQVPGTVPGSAVTAFFSTLAGDLLASGALLGSAAPQLIVSPPAGFATASSAAAPPVAAPGGTAPKTRWLHAARALTAKGRQAGTRPARTRRRVRISALSAALTAVLVAVAATLFITLGGSGGDTQIQQLVRNFASAADHADARKIADLLCQAEAAGFADSDAADSAPLRTPETHFLTTTTSDIQVAGDVASAKVTRTQKDPSPESFTTTLYFRKENGTWKVCDSASTQFSQQRVGLALTARSAPSTTAADEQGPCAAQTAALAQVQSQIAAHNAEPHTFTIPEQQAAASAYDAQAAELNAAQSSAKTALENCEVTLGALVDQGPNAAQLKPPTQNQVNKIKNAKANVAPNSTQYDNPGSAGYWRVPPALKQLYEVLRSDNPGGSFGSPYLQGQPPPSIGSSDPAFPDDVITKVTVDHIVSIPEIMSLPGFLDLSAENMYYITRAPINLQYLSVLANSAKSSREVAYIENMDPTWIWNQQVLHDTVRATLISIIQKMIATQ